MRDDDGLAGAVDGVERGAVAGVRHVERDADVVHLPNHDPAELGEAGVGAFQASATERAALVVRHLSDAQPETVQDAHQRGVVLELRREPLNPEDDSEPALALRPADVVGGLDEHEPRLDLEVAVVPVHRAEQGPEVVGAHADAADPEGDVLGGDAARNRSVEIGNAVDGLGHGLGDGQQHRHALAVDEDGLVVNLAGRAADLRLVRHGCFRHGVGTSSRSPETAFAMSPEGVKHGGRRAPCTGLAYARAPREGAAGADRRRVATPGAEIPP